MKDLKKHWFKVAVLLAVAGAIYYYKVLKPKQAAKKGAKPVSGGSAGSANHDTDLGSEAVTLENDGASNTDVGVNIPINESSDLTGGGDATTEIVSETIPILAAGGDTARHPACPFGSHWDEAEQMCIFDSYEKDNSVSVGVL
jgi:hypothetical protein